jgi:hypothetical protein
MAMNRTYVVTDRDGNVEAVFTTRALAEDAIKDERVGRGKRITECSLDPKKDKRIDSGLRCFDVSIWHGNTCGIDKHDRAMSYHYASLDGMVDTVDFGDLRPNDGGKYVDDCTLNSIFNDYKTARAIATIWARSEKQAFERTAEVYYLALRKFKDQIAQAVQKVFDSEKGKQLDPAWAVYYVDRSELTSKFKFPAQTNKRKPKKAVD